MQFSSIFLFHIVEAQPIIRESPHPGKLTYEWTLYYLPKNKNSKTRKILIVGKVIKIATKMCNFFLSTYCWNCPFYFASPSICQILSGYQKLGWIHVGWLTRLFDWCRSRNEWRSNSGMEPIWSPFKNAQICFNSSRASNLSAVRRLSTFTLSITHWAETYILICKNSSLFVSHLKLGYVNTVQRLLNAVILLLLHYEIELAQPLPAYLQIYVYGPHISGPERSFWGKIFGRWGQKMDSQAIGTKNMSLLVKK